MQGQQTAAPSASAALRPVRHRSRVNPHICHESSRPPANSDGPWFFRGPHPRLRRHRAVRRVSAIQKRRSKASLIDLSAGVPNSEHAGAVRGRSSGAVAFGRPSSVHVRWRTSVLCPTTPFGDGGAVTGERAAAFRSTTASCPHVHCCFVRLALVALGHCRCSRCICHGLCRPRRGVGRR